MSIRKKISIRIVAVEALLFILVLSASLGSFYLQLMQRLSANYGAANNVASVDAASINKAFFQAATYSIPVVVIAIILTGIFCFYFGSLITGRINKIALLAKNMKDGETADAQVDQGADEIGQLSRYIHDLGEQASLNMRDLMAAEERFRIAIKAARAGAWNWNVKTGEMYWSVGSYYALGYMPDRDKATVELWRSAIHPEDLQRVDQAIADMMVRNSSIDIEYRIVRPNGEIRWMRSVGSIHFDIQENPDEIYGLQIDITRHRKLQENLREQQSLLRVVLDNSSDSVVTLDASQNILMVNSSLLKMFQHTESELLGTPIRMLLAQDGAALIDTYIEQCLNEHMDHFERQTRPIMARRKDGSSFKASISISGLSMPDQTLRFVVSIANLANERRQVALTQAHAESQAVPS